MIISTCSTAILPPGFVLRQFQSTRANVVTMKIEERVVYADNAFNETIWYKSPDKFKVYVEKDGETLIFIRNGQKCMAITSNARLVSQDLCKSPVKGFYYTMLMPYGNFLGYLKSIGIKTDYDQTEIKKVKNEYVTPEGVFILDYDREPIYVIGVSSDIYKSALSDAKSDKKNLTDKLLANLKNKAPQIWIQTTTNYPVRIYGNDPTDNKQFEVLFGTYSMDANEFPFPTSIKLNSEGGSSLSYGVKNFDSNVGVMDEQIFNLSSYTTKFPKTIGEESLTQNKKTMLNYLKEYR